MPSTRIVPQSKKSLTPDLTPQTNLQLLPPLKGGDPLVAEFQETDGIIAEEQSGKKYSTVGLRVQEGIPQRQNPASYPYGGKVSSKV